MTKGKKQLTIPEPKALPRVTEKQRKAAKAEMDELLRGRFIRSFFGMPSRDELIDGNNYVVGSDGLYMVRKNRVGLFTSRIAETGGIKIPLVENGKQPVEGFEMTIENKIPYEFLLQTVAFFKKVYQDKKGAEAVVQIFYNSEEKSYFFNIDEQGVSGGAAEMDRDAELETNHILVADIHSHNGMAAFFSGTDNRDEKEARVYGVMGRLDQPWPQMMFRAGDGQGSWMELSMFQAFETPDVGAVEVPDEWMARVHTPADYKKRSKFYNQPHHHMEPKDLAGVYDRYVPPERRSKGSFGRVGDPNQDEFSFPITRWERDIGWSDDEEQDYLPFLHQNGDVEFAIESLIESSEILGNEECKSMWISLLEKLDPVSKDLLKAVISEA